MAPASRFKKNALAFAVFSVFGHMAHAGSAAGDIQLDDVVVAGSAGGAGGAGVGSLPANLPANSAGYSAKEIYEQVNVINTEDIVKYSPDTMTRKRYIGDRNSIIETRTASVTSSARSLVYVDGVLLSNLLGNGYSYPPRWSMVSPEEIRRVDFFFGPHSAEYPGNSIGTTVPMTTRMPEKLEAHVKAQMFSESFDQYGTRDTYLGRNVTALVGSKEGALAWFVGAGHLSSDGHPMTFATLGNPVTHASTPVTGVISDTDPSGAPRLIVGAQSQEHTEQDTAKIKLAYDLTPSVKATYTLGAWQNDSYNHAASYLRDASGNPVSSGYVSANGLTYSLNNAFGENTWRQEHFMNALTLKSRTQGAWDWEAVLSSYDISKDVQHASLPDGTKVGSKTYYGQINDNPYGDGWQTADLRGIWRSGGKVGQNAHEVSFGYHQDHYKLDSHSYYSTTANDGSWQGTEARDQLASASRGETRTEALYLQDAWRFMPDWKLVGGGRYEQWNAYGGANTKLVSGALSSASYADRSKEFFSPKLALEHELSDDWLLRGSIGQAYRMPTVTELFQAITVGTSVTTNNPDLKPERALTSELTAERGLENGLMRVSVFNEEMADALYSQSTVVAGSTVTAVQNIDKVRTYGATFAYQQNDAWIRGLDLTGSLTYAHARTLRNAANPSYEGKVFPGVPNWRATVVATYHPDDRMSYSVAARYSGYQAYQLNNSDINQDMYGANGGFLVADARLTYKLDKSLKAAIGVDNLNNAHYYAYHPMPQRTIHAELKYDY
ncbi:MAG: TonB-dependent receptor [Zoogloea sp.]|nr:TonB-dependent receptor [Zoogloea sp.]